MTYFTDVKAFHEKFDLAYDGKPRMLSVEEEEFRIKFLVEELNEVRDAIVACELPQIGGELADLVWICCGIAHRMGLPLDAHWAEIKRANMSKVKAGPNGEGSKRGSPLDIIKPKSWLPPQHADLPSYKKSI